MSSFIYGEYAMPLSLVRILTHCLLTRLMAQLSDGVRKWVHLFSSVVTRKCKNLIQIVPLL